MKKQQKDCLGNECEEIDIKMAEIINNKCDPSQISKGYTYFILCWSAPETHREPAKACFEQFSVKKEKKSNGFSGLTSIYERLEIPLI